VVIHRDKKEGEKGESIMKGKGGGAEGEEAAFLL